MHDMMICITGQNIEVISLIEDGAKLERVVFTVKSLTFACAWAIFATTFFSFTQNNVSRILFSDNKTNKIKPSMF